MGYVDRGNASTASRASTGTFNKMDADKKVASTVVVSKRVANRYVADTRVAGTGIY